MQNFTLTTGLTVIPFPFKHNWAQTVIERIGYLTPILSGITGIEQRYGLRANPRLTYEYLHTTDARNLVYAETLLQAGKSKWFALPIWTDAQRLDLTGKISGTTISIDTTYRNYAAGGMIYLYRDHFTFEIAEIASVTAESITLAHNLTGNWQKVCTITPAFVAQLEAQTNWKYLTSEIIEARIIWKLKPGQAFRHRLAMPSLDTYDLQLIYRPRHNWAESLSVTQTANRDDIDFGIGQFKAISKQNATTQNFRINQTLEGRHEISNFLAFFDDRRGAQKGFYLDLQKPDLLNSYDAQNVLVVKKTGYSEYLFAEQTRRRLAVKYADGSMSHHLVTNAQNSGGFDESVDLLTVTPIRANKPVGRISFLRLCRFETSEIEISWQTSALANVTCGFQELAI